MIAYLDASAAVRLLLDEPESELVRELWRSADRTACSPLGHVEVCAALAAATRARRIDTTGQGNALTRWAGMWNQTRRVSLTPRVERVAAATAAKHGLSGADAVHLASALELGVEWTTMAVWDRRLHAAARAEGLAVVPATLD